MSIANELSALNGYILGAYDEINDKGGTVPANKNMANLASAISSIETGGGGGGDFDFSNFYNFTKSTSGTFTLASTASKYTITHNLGVIPVLVAFYADVDFITQSDWGGDKTLGGIAIQIGNVTGRGKDATVGANSFHLASGAYTGSTSSIRKAYVESGFGAPQEIGAGSIYGVYSFTTTYAGNGCVVNEATTTTAAIRGGNANAYFMNGVVYRWVAMA